VERWYDRGVTSSGVVLAREDQPGEKWLVAYYTGSGEIDAEQLRSHLSSVLPEYMVPSAYVQLTELPLYAEREARPSSTAGAEG
jgi:hypothetical protein